jgi:hypothetical protein
MRRIEAAFDSSEGLQFLRHEQDCPPVKISTEHYPNPLSTVNHGVLHGVDRYYE